MVPQQTKQEDGVVQHQHQHQYQSPLEEYAATWQKDPFMVSHVALEYSVPHLGHESNLMFGGLGKVVDMFCDPRFATRPVSLIAPMYSPFYGDGGGGTPKSTPTLGPYSQHITTICVRSGAKTYDVDIYITASTPPPPLEQQQQSQSPPPGRCFYFLLHSPELFAYRTRGTIYTFDSEEQQLVFFSVFNQALAFVIQSFGIRCIQLHDNHGALCLRYIHPSDRPIVLLVLHNSDYNTKFALGTGLRNQYIYSMFNLQRDASTVGACEHLSKFNFLYSVVEHLKERQEGLGVVAVSPRYAVRCYHKFSMYWSLQQQQVRGILNGMGEDARVLPPPTDFDAFLEEKAVAKLSFQKRVGLEVGREKLLMVFLGRVTHQKGCDLIVNAAPAILKKHPNAQMCIAGPVGDEYGAKAAEKFKKVAETFPGRVHNAAGQYISGAAKDELLLATDFFLSPSRFEPCGLADVEMAWLGSVVIGHNTGGLGKVPGFYFNAELDNVADLTKRFEEITSVALSTPEDTLRRMSEEAVQKTFPPEAMVAAYEGEWGELRAAAHGVSLPPPMLPDESQFYEDVWTIDNTLLAPNSSNSKDKGTTTTKLETWSVTRAWWSNAFLLMAYGMFRIPSLLTMSWYQYSLVRASVVTGVGGKSWAAYWPLLIRVVVTIIVSPLWQLAAVVVAPRVYVYITSAGFVMGCLCGLWAVLCVQASSVLYIIGMLCSLSAVPLIGFIFLNNEGKVSVSEYGVPLMGLTDAFLYISIGLVGSQMHYRDEDSLTGLIVFCCIFLVLAALLLTYFAAKGSLPPHFDHFRLRFKGQLRILARRRAWIAFTGICFTDTFLTMMLLGAAIQYSSRNTIYTVGVIYPFSSAIFILLWCWLLMSPIGSKLSLKLYYALSLFPLMPVAQMAVLCYSGPHSDWRYIAASFMCVYVIRISVVGVLTLQTIPSRELLSAVTTLQVVVGSTAVASGAAFGYLLSTPWSWTATVGVIEAVRTCLVLLFIWLHRRENIATP